MSQSFWCEDFSHVKKEEERNCESATQTFNKETTQEKMLMTKVWETTVKSNETGRNATRDKSKGKAG